ncbi:MAG: hypothetical protein ACRC6F_11845, partial [Aeromonas sp.]
LSDASFTFEVSIFLNELKIQNMSYPGRVRINVFWWADVTSRPLIHKERQIVKTMNNDCAVHF